MKEKITRAMQNSVNEVSDQIISAVNIPQGWEVVEEANPADTFDILNIESLRKDVSDHLPDIARRVEKFIATVDNRYDIVISASYIFIDADAAYHIMLLVTQSEFVSPHMIQVKMLANDQLTTSGDVSMRFKITIAEEYLRFHYTERAYKLRYVYSGHELSTTPSGKHTKGESRRLDARYFKHSYGQSW